MDPQKTRKMKSVYKNNKNNNIDKKSTCSQHGMGK